MSCATRAGGRGRIVSADFSSIVALLSCLSAGVVGWCASGMWLARRLAFEQRRTLRQSAGVEVGSNADAHLHGVSGAIVRYATELSRRLTHKTTRSLAKYLCSGPLQRFGRRGDVWFSEHARKAGLAVEVSHAGFREAGVRLALVGAAVGGLIGVVLSNELAALLGFLGLVGGAVSPRWAVRVAEARRTAEVERHLSEMLEVIALGLRSGLSFDRSFELYAQYFSSPFAGACGSVQRRWSLGLSTRDEALRSLAASYGSDQLTRVIENIVRSLRFGSSLAEGLEAAAVEARAEYRARMEEKVARAPVKMMMPTGALILPAMLLLVLGPVLLDLGGGF